MSSQQEPLNSSNNSQNHLIDDQIYVNTSTSSVSNGVLVFVLIISLIMNAIILYFVLGYSLSLSSITQDDSSFGIRRVLLEHEYEKVGGKKNYDILQKYSQIQINQQIDQIEKFVSNTGNPERNTDSRGNRTKTLSSTEIQSILQDAYLEGNKDASLVVIEYSDMECPYCTRQYHETKLFPNLIEKYGDKIALAFKNNRGVDHKGTEAKAVASLCAGKVGGSLAYQKFYKSIMDQSTRTNGMLDVSKLPEIAKKNLGANFSQWKSCYDKKETLSQFSSQTQEAQKLGLGGTPGTLILNIKTGKYETVEGAYPLETFIAKIDTLLE